MSTLDELVQRFWIAPDDAEWIPKTDVLPLSEVRKWMKSEDVEVLGFAAAMIGDGRFRIEPPLPVDEYASFQMHYVGRCLRESPDGEWSDSAYSAGWNLVRIYIHLWEDERVPRPILLDMKRWLADIYKGADEKLRLCVVHVTLEHLFERGPIRQFFNDWQKDPALAEAYKQASLWDRKTPLSSSSGKKR